MPRIPNSKMQKPKPKDLIKNKIMKRKKKQNVLGPYGYWVMYELNVYENAGQSGTGYAFSSRTESKHNN